jgi:hypothetical protein
MKKNALIWGLMSMTLTVFAAVAAVAAEDSSILQKNGSATVTADKSGKIPFSILISGEAAKLAFDSLQKPGSLPNAHGIYVTKDDAGKVIAVEGRDISCGTSGSDYTCHLDIGTDAKTKSQYPTNLGSSLWEACKEDKLDCRDIKK